MRFRSACSSRLLVSVICLVTASPALIAQSPINSIQLFGPVIVRPSAAGTGYGSDAAIFNSTTLNLTCPADQISAMLSSSADSTGNVIVDNNINLTVIAGVSTTGPANVCTGGVTDSTPAGPLQDCFTTGLQQLGSAGELTGKDPDNFVATGGVAPIDISQSFVPGPIQVKIDLVDQGSGTGYYLSSSTLYLNTNCTQGGVTGPALVSGNPIPATGATPDQLAQDFPFNNLPNQSIGFTYDLTLAQSQQTLSIADSTIPQVGDSPIDPLVYQSVYVPGTSFATSICLVHSGELLPSGQAGCKLYTLECKVGTGATATGAQCPISTQNNEIFQDAFNGPAFTLPDIPTPNGPTFHQGVGFLMANEGWTGGPCTFDPNADLQGLPCPQNLLTSFTSGIADAADVSKSRRNPVQAAAVSGFHPRAASTTPTSGSYTSTGRTTHPNSTFLTIAQVPEDLTTVTVAGQKPGYWINGSTASFTLSSQPPVLAGTQLPGAASFVASPIQSLTYGISPASTVPLPGDPTLNDTVVPSGVTCPTQANPSGQPATVFTPGTQSISGLTEGYYLLHYYAQDCAGTEELKFTQDVNSNWSTSFYTYPINVDLTPPAVASGPTLSPAPSAQGTYTVGQVVTASYSCTDALSGVVSCGTQTYATGTSSTGTINSPVDTSSVGPKTFTVQTVDAAGNQSSASVNYQVVSPYDSQIQFSVTPQNVTYPGGTNIAVTISPLPAPSIARRTSSIRSANAGANALSLPTGTVQILDGAVTLKTLTLKGNGTASYFLQGLGAGSHSISIVYSGDAVNPAGFSAPIILKVQPAPVKLDVGCSNFQLRYGDKFVCGVYTDSPAGGAKGYITYTYDNGAPKTVPLFFGFGLFEISNPTVGPHTVVVSYPAQTNYAAAIPKTVTFTVRAK